MSLQARFGVARFGASRFGSFYPNLVIKINGTDRARYVVLNTLQIEQRLNEQPDRATFIVRDTVTPAVGQSVVIALGGDFTTGTRIFGGTIVAFRQLQGRAGEELRYELDAIDYTFLLDRRLVTAEWTGDSATDIAMGIISGYTTGFTYGHVQSGLSAIDSFPATNERPSTLLSRLATDAGCDWYIDENRDLHFFTTEAASFPNPTSITSSNRYFWDFDARQDERQVRTRIIGEGRRTRLLRTVVPNGTVGSLPVEDASIFDVFPAYVRIGRDVLTTTYAIIPVLDGNRLGAKLSADAAVGATTLSVDSLDWYDNVPIPGGGIKPNYIRIGDQILNVASVTGAGPYTVTLADSNFGAGSDALQGTIGAGTPFTAVDTLVIPAGLVYDASMEEDVVSRILVDDTAAQTALAALEGGDGIHEMLIQDGRLSLTTLQEQAAAELDALGAAIASITYKTRDTSTRAGRTVTVTLGTISDDFLIQEVRYTEFDRCGPLKSKHVGAWPVREVTAMPLRLANLVDLVSQPEAGS